MKAHTQNKSLVQKTYLVTKVASTRKHPLERVIIVETITLDQTAAP